ncbi:MAG: hypothetical protein JJ992_17795, partial [Planctomycetes bacterium]|nr:hypothetical protein [Planctomycetota bacterium]
CCIPAINISAVSNSCRFEQSDVGQLNSAVNLPCAPPDTFFDIAVDMDADFPLPSRIANTRALSGGC